MNAYPENGARLRALIPSLAGATRAASEPPTLSTASSYVNSLARKSMMFVAGPLFHRRMARPMLPSASAAPIGGAA